MAGEEEGFLADVAGDLEEEEEEDVGKTRISAFRKFHTVSHHLTL